MAKVNFSIRIEGSKFDSFWPKFCFQKIFGPVFCSIPLPYKATTLVSSNFRPFQRELWKKFLRTYLETKSNSRRKEQSSLVKQGKNAMKSIGPREEQPSSKAKRSFKTMYDERMTSLRTDGLSSGDDSPTLMHSDMGFFPIPRQEKSKKALFWLTN